MTTGISRRGLLTLPSYNLLYMQGSLHYVYQSSEIALFRGSVTLGEEEVTYPAYKVYQEVVLSPTGDNRLHIAYTIQINNDNYLSL